MSKDALRKDIGIMNYIGMYNMAKSAHWPGRSSLQKIRHSAVAHSMVRPGQFTFDSGE